MFGFGFGFNRTKGGAAAFNPANEPNTQFYSDPTIASSINAGSPSPADPISILGDLAPSGNDGTQGTAINRPLWNTTHWTSLTNDTINIDNVLTDIASSTNGTVEGWLRHADATKASTEYIVTFGDTSSNEFFMIRKNATSGKLICALRIAGVTQWQLETDAVAFINNTWMHFNLVQNGTEPMIYINNVAVAQTFTTSTDKTKWFNDASGLDNGRLACLNFNSSGDGSFFDGDYQQIYISTDVKDSDTRTNLYNHNQPS